MKNILMNAEMTKAILDGRKTQTRRIVDITKFDNDTFIQDQKIVHHYTEQGMPDGCGGYEVDHCNDDVTGSYSKYKIGDIIWVREPVRIECSTIDYMFFKYQADLKEEWLPIPFRFFYPTPKWMAECQGIPNGCIKEMARIFLKITDVRVERLFDLTYDDIQEEGYSEVAMNSISGFNWYIDLWNKTAPKGYRWDDNPYVFVYEFERVKEKQDA